MRRFSIAGLTLASVLAAAMPALAGSWLTQATLATNGYQGSVALDASGNMVSVWDQETQLNGSQVSEIWASTATFGRSWSSPVDVSGSLGTGAGYPAVRSSAAGKATVVYTNPNSGTGLYADHPAGGSWGAPGATNGVNQFYVSDNNGDEVLAWGTGGARPTSSTIVAVERLAGSSWGSATTIAAAPHLSFDGAVIAPDSSMAVAWESFDSTCGSRTCKTSNWVLHISTRAAGSLNWLDSGPLLGPDATQHFGQLAADGLGDLGVVSLKGGNIVSVVRHGPNWSGPVVVASASSFQYYTGTGRDNRIFATDANGHATLVGWGDIHLLTLAAIDGNLATNTWGAPTTISGSDQSPGYFDFAMSSSGAAIVFWPILNSGGTGTTLWRAATRAAGKPWNAPATAGTSYEGGGTPDGIAVNGAGQALVLFHGYSSDLTTNILYTSAYQP